MCYPWNLLFFWFDYKKNLNFDLIRRFATMCSSSRWKPIVNSFTGDWAREWSTDLVFLVMKPVSHSWSIDSIWPYVSGHLPQCVVKELVSLTMANQVYFTPQQRSFMVTEYARTGSPVTVINRFHQAFPEQRSPAKITVLMNFAKYQLHATSLNFCLMYLSPKTIQ